MEWFLEKYAGTQYFILDIMSGPSMSQWLLSHLEWSCKIEGQHSNFEKQQ